MVTPAPTNILPATLTGRTLGDFLVMEKLAEGGVGAAYRAQQTLLGREAVIKVLLAGSDADGHTQSRFLREARLASRLDHPYAVAVYAFGAEPDGLLWIAMELVRGKNLGVYLKEHGPMPLARFGPFFDALCDVVDAMHEKGIIHRDIKPSNVMVMMRNGRLLPKLLDLGIATVAQREQQEALSVDEAAFLSSLDKTPRSSVETRSRTAAHGGPYVPAPTPVLLKTNTLLNTPTTLNRIELAEKLSITSVTDAVGSPAYMAPEQWLNSRDVTAQADVYSLGVLAWQMLTGQLPYLAKTTSSMALSHLQAAIPRLPSGFPEGLQGVFDGALAKDPKSRPDRAASLGRALLSVALANQRVLPSISEALRQEWVDAAPQPLAETIALLEVVRTAQTGLDTSRKALRLLARFLALLGVMCRQRVGPASDEQEAPLTSLISALRNGRLEHHAWVSLLWLAVHPWALQRERYPLPGLLDFCVTPEGTKTEAMLALENADLEQVPGSEEEALVCFERLVAKLGPVLRAADFLLRHTLTRASAEPGVFEAFSGCRRPVRSAVQVRMPSAVEGDLFLVDETLTATLRLNPLIQTLAPSPGEPPDIFLFSGAGRYGARLVSAPREFERQDEATWSWLDANWPRASHDSDLNRAEDKPPYRGLASFTASDAQDFFGREPEAQAVANRLRVSPFLAVVGPSGVGKSSFVQAGVAPLLADDLSLVVVRPGNTPLATLVAKLKTLGVDAEGLQAAVEKDPTELGRRFTELANAKHGKYLVVIDQFEELITLCQSATEREAYAAALVSASSNADGPLRVVLTLRDDFLIRAQGLDALKDHLSTGLHLLGTPGENELLRILTQPLKRVGYAFEDSELPRQMVKEVAQQPGALALLSFSATKLWATRDTHFRRLTRQAYQAMGGVGGALAGHAEETLASMSDEQRLVTREAFRHLVSSSGTRAVLTRSEANELLGSSQAGARVLEKLIDARLLVTSEAGGGDDRVEIIHEALLSSWPRLVQWQRENAELARVRDALRSASRQWNDQSRPRGMLWRDETLTEYRLWRPKYPGALTAIEQAFAQASVAEFERGRRIRRGLLIAAFAVLSIGMVVLIRANGRAEENAQRANENATESSHRLTLMTAEQGRQAFLTGHPAEALALLTTAADAGLDNAGLRYMLEKSRRAVAGVSGLVDMGLNITAVTLSPDRLRLAVGLSDGTVTLLDSKTLASHGTFKALTGSVRGLRFTPDNATVILCGADGAVSLWDAATLSRFDSLKLDPTALVACQLSNDGKTLVVGGINSQSHVVGIEGHVLKARSMGQYETSTIRGAFISPDGTRFVVAMAEPAGPPPPTKRHPIESLTGAPSVWLEGLHGPVYSAAWSPDGKSLFTGADDALITQWDAETGKKKSQFTGHRGTVTALVVSADGAALYSAATDGTLRIWDIGTSTAKTTIAAHERVRDLLVPSGADVIVTGGFDGVVKVWSPAGQLRKAWPPLVGGLSSLGVDVPGDRLLIGTFEGTLRLYQLSAVDYDQAISVPSDTAGIALDGPEAQLVYGRFSGPFFVRPMTEGASATELKATLLEDRAFAVTPNADRIVSDRGGTLEVTDRDNKVLQTFKGHPDGEASVQYNENATAVLAIGAYVMPLLYDTRTGVERVFPEPVRTAASSFATTGSGSDVWVGNNEGEVFLWPEKGPLRRKKFSKALVLAVQQSPDGKVLGVATFDQRVRLLDADTLEEVASGIGLTVAYMGFSADSKLMVVADSAGQVQVWSVQPFQLIDSRKVGQKLFALTTLRKSARFMTLTPEGLLVWPL